MANEFIIKNGFHSKGDSQVTGSINVSNTVFGGGLLIDGTSVLSGSVTVHATNVGSPIINFENDGTNSPLARITGQSYGGGVNGGLDFLYHNGTSLTEGFRLRNGRIGIGTTNPSQALEVAGNISASGYISASNGFIGDGSQLTNIDPFPYTGDAVITGSLVVTGSIEMALPSASAFKSFGVPGYYKITIPYNADTIIFQDENFYLEYNDAITDQLEAKVTTDPSSGTVDFVYWNNNDDTYVTFEKNASDSEFDIDSTFTNWEKATLEIFSTEDSSYPTYHVTFNSADNVRGIMVLQKFV